MSDNSAADFMRDQLEALLASPALWRVAERHNHGPEPLQESERSDASLSDRETDPSIDTQTLRDPLSTRVK